MIMKLSIIVPIYNVEAYIEKCAKSLLNQNVTKDTYEVIFVNDGTKDNSISVLCKTIDFTKHENFHLIEKENGGLSSARNYGLEYANGEYVWFVDSDDWIEVNCLQSIIELLRNIDILEFSSYYREENETKIIKNERLIPGKGREVSQRAFWHPAPFHIYKKELFVKNNMKFKIGVLHEDSQLIPRILYLADNVGIFKAPVYHYLCRQGSITQNIKKKNIDDLIDNISDLIFFMNTTILPEDKEKWSRVSIFPVLNELLYLSQKCNDLCAKKATKKFVNNHPEFYHYYKNSKKLGYRIIAYLSLLFSKNIYLSYKLLYPIRYKLLKNG